MIGAGYGGKASLRVGDRGRLLRESCFYLCPDIRGRPFLVELLKANA